MSAFPLLLALYTKLHFFLIYSLPISYVQTVDPKVQENKYEVCGTNKVNEISIWCSAMTQKNRNYNLYIFFSFIDICMGDK